MEAIKIKPDMTNWSEERKKTFQCLAVEKKETFEEILANIYPLSAREKLRELRKHGRN